LHPVTQLRNLPLIEQTGGNSGMSVKLGVVMDPIQILNYKKDSTLAMQ